MGFSTSKLIGSKRGLLYSLASRRSPLALGFPPSIPPTPTVAHAKGPNRSNGRDHSERTCHVAHDESAMKKRKRPPAEIDLRRPALRRRLERRGPGLRRLRAAKTPHWPFFADGKRRHFLSIGFRLVLGKPLHLALAPTPATPGGDGEVADDSG